ncbi:hypothetical protein MXB_1409 [Myxobolus squamalis]|nr:hypothetical protein MXB_1409 [Myxobolus squamalis]
MLAIVIILIIFLDSFNELSIEKKILDTKWLEYMLEYKLNFSKSEETDRKEIFLKNYAFIVESNRKNMDFTLKMNNFGHLGKNERLKLLMSYSGKRLQKEQSSIFVGRPIASELDWRKFEVVSPVQDQLECGSCYAFGVIDAIESQFAIHTGVLPHLSKQEIVDCSWKYGNYGCYGGFDESDEDNLLRALFYIGPISISIDAYHDELFFYESGIIDFPSCSSENVNHIVLAVGYSLNKRPYLLVKNRFFSQQDIFSWGKDWGMDGYLKVALFRNNMCGIASYASYPIPKIEN